MEELALRVVFDTNVYLTALAGRSGYLLGYLRWVRPGSRPRLFQLFVSAAILAELRAVAVGKLGLAEGPPLWYPPSALRGWCGTPQTTASWSAPSRPRPTWSSRPIRTCSPSTASATSRSSIPRR